MKTQFTIATCLLCLLFSGAAYAVQFENNVPAAVKDLAVSDLAFLQAVIGHQQSPLHVNLVGKVDGTAYITWFSARVESFGYDVNDHSGAIAYNDSSLVPNHMMVTDYFVKGNLPQVGRLMTLLHEARHSETSAGFWPHANCPIPFTDEAGHEITSIFSGLPLAGHAGCDVSVNGAYGTATILISNIGRFCENCSEKIRQDAALYSRDQANRIIIAGEHLSLLKDATEVAPAAAWGTKPLVPVVVVPPVPPSPVITLPAWPGANTGSWPAPSDWPAQ